jgi:hypothetical protein
MEGLKILKNHMQLLKPQDFLISQTTQIHSYVFRRSFILKKTKSIEEQEQKANFCAMCTTNNPFFTPFLLKTNFCVTVKKKLNTYRAMFYFFLLMGNVCVCFFFSFSIKKKIITIYDDV